MKSVRTAATLLAGLALVATPTLTACSHIMSGSDSSSSADSDSSSASDKSDTKDRKEDAEADKSDRDDDKDDDKASASSTSSSQADASAWLDEVLLAEALSSSLSSSLSLLSASASSLRSLVSLLSDADELSESAELDESEPDMMCEQAVRVGVATRARPASRVAAVRTDFMMLRGLRDKDLGRTSWSAGNALWRQLPNGGACRGGLASRGCQRTVVRMVDTMVSTSSALPAVTAMRT